MSPHTYEILKKSMIAQKPTWSEYDDMSVYDTEILIMIEHQKAIIRKEKSNTK